ncbi:MAG: threonine/serine dehydratase [Tissierellia bacterium]|nr:threonine/serine dehydratase [Tissierellia bacterium]
MEFGIKNIEVARERINNSIIKTPLIRVENLDEHLGFEVYLKLENMQKTGSFKFRGAMNKILSLSDEELQKGIICASSGNHGKAIAFAAKELGIPGIIVMPETAPKNKIKAIEELGARVVLCDASERFIIAEQLREENDMTMAPPFDDYDIMAGQGTCGLEIIEEVPELDYVIVPVSGGGLIGGVATAIKDRSDKTKVIGAEPKNAAAYTVSLKEGSVSTAEQLGTIADALVSVTPGVKNFPVVKEKVDDILDVSEEYILKGMKLLLLEGKILAEPSSGIGIGSILEKKIDIPKGSKVCFIISGGSVSLEQLKILDDIEI